MSWMEQLAQLWRRFWHWHVLANIRRNHAVEHATIHLLSARLPGTKLAGRSTSRGFYVYGDVPITLLEQAVREAVVRLRRGEHELALHPHCGTNLVAASTLAGFATALAMVGRRRRWWDRLLAALAAALAALTVAQPLGYWLQEHVTTEASIPEADIVHIRRFSVGRMPVHFVRMRYTES